MTDFIVWLWADENHLGRALFGILLGVAIMVIIHWRTDRSQY